jgi:hypothetical protein
MSTDSALSYGTLDTQASTAGIESQAGVTMAMFELNWASFEPRSGVVSASYLATMRSYLRVYRAAGQLVTLGPGLQNPPPERPLHQPVRRGHDGQRAAPGPFLQIHRLLLGPRRPPVGRNDSVYPVRRDDRRSGGQAGERARGAPSVMKKGSLRRNGPWYHRSGT